MSFIDDADRVRDSILGNIQWASTFGNQLNENFVGQQEIPERLSRTRMNDLENRFNIQSRLATWQDDLAARSAESQFNNWQNNYRLSEFDDMTREESLQRDLNILNTRANIDNFESEQKLGRLKTRLDYLQTENEVETLTFDKQYTEIISNIPNYGAMTPSQKYEAVMDYVNENNVHEKVRDRVDKKFLENASADIDKTRDLINSIREVEYYQQLGVRDIKNPMLKGIMQRLISNLSSIRDLDGILRIGTDLGIFTPTEAGSVRQAMGIDPGAGLQEAANTITGNTEQGSGYGNFTNPDAPYYTGTGGMAPEGEPDPNVQIEEAVNSPAPVVEPTPVPQQAPANFNPVNATANPDGSIGSTSNVNTRIVTDETGALVRETVIREPYVPSPEQQALIEQEAAEITPPINQAENQPSIPYRHDPSLDLAEERGVIGRLESQPYFPPNLRGVLGKKVYTYDTLRDEIIKLDQLGVLFRELSKVMPLTDSETLIDLNRLFEAKSESIISFLRENGINPREL